MIDKFDFVPKNVEDSLAPYASISKNTKGRLYKEPICSQRSEFRRDCDRIIHSSAFRRLEYKTQVFVSHEGDHYRTRLTHSLEVAQIARAIARNLNVNEDLAEALALAHDLGHPPFGHAGEDAINLANSKNGGFDHNAQTLKILTKLENRYADFEGLNLSFETLEGVVKHNGPIKLSPAVPCYIGYYNSVHNLELDKYAASEAQVAAIADDIAYLNHDIDDGIRSGLVESKNIEELPVIGSIFFEVRKKYGELSREQMVYEVLRRMINKMISDITLVAVANINLYKIDSAEAIRNLGKPLVTFSPEMKNAVSIIKKYLLDNLYRNPEVISVVDKGKRVVTDLFCFFKSEPQSLPGAWRNKAMQAKTDAALSEIVVDYIAGMTDRFALEEHSNLFSLKYKA